MKKIVLNAAEIDSDPQDEERYKGKRFLESDLRHIVVYEDATFFRPDGSVLCILLKRALTGSSVRATFEALKDFHSPPTNRSVTVLGKSELAKRADGTRSRTVTVSVAEHPEVRGMTSGIVGYYDRTVRMPFCRATAFSLKHPEKFEKMLPMLREVNGLFAKTLPDRYAAQAAAADKTNRAWIIPGTVFSTVTVNKNYNAACHQDAGDLRAGFGLMSAIRLGTYTGGITYWPAYKIGVRMDSGDLCLADVHEWHGVTDVKGVPGRFERLSLVFYLREKMCRCGSPEQELERAKLRAAGMPLYDKEEIHAGE